ncbi:VWA domain-containing protein [Veronia pacifica]|uniref:VWA domain-containing protein n=1 Tax=Veronia pacifica TaxID=1080227 RepID=A0A1C3EEA7_9GAMM|nr:VWA domain-containing protein [Veronia pacifica]ODA31576.1 hypothetical protein A8L45_16345 [Veronia pacifica]
MNIHMPFPVIETERKMIAFMRDMKQRGFLVDTETEQLALSLLAEHDFFDRQGMALTLKPLMCDSRVRWLQFEPLFNQYWSVKPVLGGKVKTRGLHRAENRHQNQSEQSGEPFEQQTGESTAPRAGAVSDDIDEETLRRYRASSADSVERIDFSNLDPAMLNRLSAACEAMVRQWLRCRQSSSASSRLNQSLDIRQTVRSNLQHGGLLLELQWRATRTEAPKVSIFIDVSRSMEKHTSLFLLFAMAMVRQVRDSRVYVFNTQLSEVTDTLNRQQYQKVREKILLQQMCWGGGTKIASCFDQWLSTANKPARRNHYVLVLSDGLDTDPRERFETAIRGLRRCCRKLIWLNPLMLVKGYDIDTQSFAGVMDCIDHMMPANSIDSFAELTSALNA